MAKKDKKKNAQATYHGGLTYKEFKEVNKRGMQLNDIAWAGRLYAKMPFWNARLTKITLVCFVITVLSLGGMWVSVFMRNPALLLGVYPDGEITCFPRLRAQTGKVVPIPDVYQQKCSAIDARVGRKWQLDNKDGESDVVAVGNINTKAEYRKIKEIEEQALQLQAPLPVPPSSIQPQPTPPPLQAPFPQPTYQQ